MLIQARMDIDDGLALRELAIRRGVPVSAYLRVLAKQHLQAVNVAAANAEAGNNDDQMEGVLDDVLRLSGGT
jgi:hypothetical protein